MTSNTLKTNFTKVMEFNRAFDMVPQEPSIYSSYVEDLNGNIKYNPLKNIRKDIFRDSTPIIKLRLALIKEEIEELNGAILQNDLIEQRDACSDILYVVYGMADVLGISIDDYFSMKINTQINDNLNYYINNNLTTDFLLKTEINTNNYNHNHNHNTTDTNIDITSHISNFNKVKLIKNEILNFNISGKPRLELIYIIKSNINKTYLELENSCLVSEIDYFNDETITSKFEIVANNLHHLLKLAYLMTYVIGADADADFAIVHDSNMSKLCDNIEDAKETVKDYQVKFIAGVSPYDTPYYYHLPTLNKWIVKNLTTGKALKNIKYKKVSFKNPRFVF